MIIFLVLSVCGKFSSAAGESESGRHHYSISSFKFALLAAHKHVWQHTFDQLQYCCCINHKNINLTTVLQSEPSWETRLQHITGLICVSSSLAFQNPLAGFPQRSPSLQIHLTAPDKHRAISTPQRQCLHHNMLPQLSSRAAETSCCL